MKRWAVLLGALVVVLIVLADTNRLGFLGGLYNFPYGDKVGHFVVFGALSLVVNLAVFEAWPLQERRWLALRTCLALALLIGLEESSQRWFPGRTASLFDLAAGYLGVAVFAGVALLVASRQAKD